jgi:hypothetical protein
MVELALVNVRMACRTFERIEPESGFLTFRLVALHAGNGKVSAGKREPEIVVPGTSDPGRGVACNRMTDCAII